MKVNIKAYAHRAIKQDDARGLKTYLSMELMNDVMKLLAKKYKGKIEDDTLVLDIDDLTKDTILQTFPFFIAWPEAEEPTKSYVDQ